jgi:hypothetical protein
MIHHIGIYLKPGGAFFLQVTRPDIAGWGWSPESCWRACVRVGAPFRVRQTGIVFVVGRYKLQIVLVVFGSVVGWLVGCSVDGGDGVG